MWKRVSKIIIIVTTGLILQSQIRPSNAVHGASCVGISTSPVKKQEHFKQAIGSIDFYNANPYAWPYDADVQGRPTTFNARIYGVLVDDKPLRGWFHIVIAVPSNFVSFYLHAVDESTLGNVGEFVHNFPACTDPPGHGVHEDLPEYMYLPCGGTIEAEPLLSTGIKFLRNPSSNYAHLTPSTFKTEFHFMYRLATTACAQPTSISLFGAGATCLTADPPCVFVMGSREQVFLSATDIIGAPDPIPRNGTYKSIKCHEPFTNVKYVTSKQPGDVVETARSCSVDTDQIFNSRPLYRGRCPRDLSNEVHMIDVNKCPLKKDDGTGFDSYQDYLNNMTQRYKELCEPCPYVPPKPITTLRPETSESKMGVPLTVVTAQEVWDGRIIHGISMTIISIFLLPLNIFITRHFKETFMGTRILLLRVWYFVHHLATGIIIVFYCIGFGRIFRNRKLLGVSLHVFSSIHHLVGWTTVAVTVFMTIFGGWRCMSRLPRNICIAMHWTIGMAVYFANYFLMILSVWIPGSPAAAVDFTQTIKSGSTEVTSKTELILFLIIGWIVLDLALHLAMTVFTCITDAKCKLSERRLYLPSPIPVFRENVTDDIKGSKVRKLLLVVYASLSFLITLAICYLLITQNTSGRGLGEMSCTHKPKGRGALPRGTKTACDN